MRDDIALIDRVLSDSASPQEADAFAARVASDPAFAREVMRQSMLLSDLQSLDKSRMVGKWEDQPATHSKAARVSGGRLRWMGLGLGLAAAVVLAAAVLLLYRPSPSADLHPSNPDRSPSFATLIESTGDLFVDDQPAVEGGFYRPGTYSIKSGSAELLLTNRVSVKLSGNTTLAMHSNQSATLTHGSATFDVPHDVQGFAVGLPDGIRIIDLGTKFGASVAPDASTDVDVFQGRVRVEFAGESHELIAGQAIRFVRGQVESIDPMRGAFADEHAYERWKQFAESLRSDSDTLLYESFADEHPVGVLGGDPKRADGRFAGKPALAFDGRDDYMAVDIPGQFMQLTFAAWVNVQSFDHDLNDLFATDGVAQGMHLHLTRDGRFACAFIGANDIKTPVLIGPEDFNRWVHLTVVIDHVAGFVDLYRDGQLVHHEIVPPDQRGEISIGPARIGNWNPTGVPADFDTLLRGLHARFDEVLLSRDAMTAQQINAMYLAGKPAQPHTISDPSRPSAENNINPGDRRLP